MNTVPPPLNGPQLLDGKLTAESVLRDCAAEVENLAKFRRKPGLAVILVGDDPASRAYVQSKERMCQRLGMHSVKIELPATADQEELLGKIHTLNHNPAIHGILVQSPLPPHMNEPEIVMSIAPQKDIDGFHPENVAKLTLEKSDGFVPCTPAGCMKLLQHYNIETSGARAVVLGRSMIVGKPMALLLMSKGSDATVTVAHSRTKNLPAICREADILIAAIGRPDFVTAEFVKEGAVVIDVGINRVDDPDSPRGYRLTGDVNFAEVAPKTRAITPVPGGVGPMTIAMLMANTVKACKAQTSDL